MPMNVNERDPDERVVEIETERLRDFRNHPFKIKPDQQMALLMESISKYGILTPLIVRPLPEGVYEIISGHRRRYAAQLLGYRKLPVIIRVMRDDDAIISMIDANLNRNELLPSEKANAIRMKYDAIKRKAGRKKSGQEGHHLTGKKTVQIMGEQAGESPKQIQRYLKITELIPELMDKLDAGEISFNPAYELAFLKAGEQQDLIRAMEYTQASPSVSQAQRLKRLSKEESLSLDQMKAILGEVKKGEVNRVMFKNEQLRRFFPEEYSAEHMKEEIIRILTLWVATKAGRPVKQPQAQPQKQRTVK